MSQRDTKSLLLDHGTRLLLERGYSDTGLQDILRAAGVPKGSFYHHFRNKEDFGLQAMQQYADAMYRTLDGRLNDDGYPQVERLRLFFSGVFEGWKRRNYRDGCLLGILGQELADVNEGFREAISNTLDLWGRRIAVCLADAQQRGELAAGIDPVAMAGLLLDGYEGAALRMRLERNERPLTAFISHYFDEVLTNPKSN